MTLFRFQGTQSVEKAFCNNWSHELLFKNTIIDNNLSWKRHIDCVAIKMSRTVELTSFSYLSIRFIYFSEQNQHTIPLFIDAGVLPLKFLYYELLAHLFLK